MKVQQDAEQPRVAPPRKAGGQPGARPPAPKQQAASKYAPSQLPEIPKKGGKVTFQNFVEWWASLDNAYADKAIAVYVYRIWPEVDMRKYDPKAVVNIEVLPGCCPFTPDNWRLEVMERWGSGNYKLQLNENGVPRHAVYTEKQSDLENHPPKIDYDLLIGSADPAFAKWAQMKGLYNGFNEKKDEGKEDMAALDALATMADTVSSMAERAVESAERRAAAPAPVQDTGTTQMAMGLMKTAVDTITKASEMGTRNQPDPIAQFAQIANIIQKATPQPVPDTQTGMLMEFLKANAEAAQRRETQAMTEAAELRKQIIAMVTAPKQPEGGGGIKDQLSSFRELKEILAELGGGGGGGEASAPAPKGGEGWLDILARNAPQIMNGLAVITGNIANTVAMSRTPAGAPMQPYTPAPTLQSAAPSMEEQATAMVASMTPALLHHLAISDGHEFAGWFIASGADNRLTYDQMKEAGPDMIKALLGTYEPLWARIKDTPAKLDAFIGEFLEYDTWLEQGDAQGV
jgi:hypothetical protein